MPTRLLKRFAGSERGSMSVEAVLIFPLLLWGLAALFIYWDAFKAQNLNLKATYTIADLISRQSLDIPESYINGMNSVYGFLIREGDGNDIRVSVIRFVENPADPGGDPIMELQWSEATGTVACHDDETFFLDKLPLMQFGEELIVVETRMTWNPPIEFGLGYIGLDTQDFSNMVFTTTRNADGETEYDGTPTCS